MKKIYLIFFLFLSLKNFATHIVGGEMIYDYIGKDVNGKEQYRITLRVYRDCATGNAEFDGILGAAIITVREGNGVLTGTYNIGVPVVTKIPPSINSPCANAANDICVEEGVYTTTLTLPSKTGGYYVIYQRCCRNNTISNLLNPGDQGSTYYTKIPGPEAAAINSSPRFINFPPLYLCNDLDLLFDHSATDPDGDQLVYSFYAPFLGADICCPAIANLFPGNCASPPPACPTEAPALPYPTVNYAASFSGNYPLPASTAFSVNAVTGQLTGKPNAIGQFVVGVCVKEYRNNQLINTHYRDFQFNVRFCPAPSVSEFKAQSKLCEGSTLTFTNNSTATRHVPTALWDFGINNISNDTSVLFEPVYTFADTGKYTVTLISDPHGPCADTLTKDVYVYPKLEVSYLPPPKQCLKNNSYSFNAEGLFNPATTFFNWDFTSAASPPTSTLSNPTHIVFSSGGLFPIRLTAKQFICRDTFINTINIFDRPAAPIIHWDTTVVVGEPAPLNAFAGAGYTYTWTPLVDYLNCSTCITANPVSSTFNDITYSVSVEDELRCTISKSTYHVMVDYKASIDVPGAFTPNGDGVNDIIYVDGWGLKKLIYFRVYNRWGQLLFESNDIKTGWDGRFNGTPQNMETYIYQASVETYVKDKPVLTKDGLFKIVR